MKKLLATSALALAFAIPAVSAHAEEGGCLKYGAAGAVAGHFVGKHHVLGAVGGCAVGAYKRHKARKLDASKAAAYDKEQAEINKKNAQSSQQSTQAPQVSAQDGNM